MIPTPRIWISFNSRRNPEEAPAAHPCNISDTREEKTGNPKPLRQNPSSASGRFSRRGRRAGKSEEEMSFESKSDQKVKQQKEQHFVCVDAGSCVHARHGKHEKHLKVPDISSTTTIKNSKQCRLQ